MATYTSEIITKTTITVTMRLSVEEVKTLKNLLDNNNKTDIINHLYNTFPSYATIYKWVKEEKGK